ncbi:class I SAM-dependent methyltransferase [Sorangium sp. So ce295]|jgi:SAM-dependent methyltransferase|uniref:class I SAM-dependent methyltransferase n=1 Tax=Sorangium sp. So ce295 TaxID=3133295 RepID=UPI003F61AAF4
MSEPSQNVATPPAVRDADADHRFRESARRHGWDPDDPWVGGYATLEWRRSRHAYDDLFTSVRGKKVLEFGCHFGGTSIVLATLGAEVTALDVDPMYVELAQLNVERHGLSDRIRVHHVPDTTAMPFADGEFELVSCNSVLEYVPPERLPAVQREIDRVLGPWGFIVILGTSNRLWPVECHSRRPLMNYVPRLLRPLFPGRSIYSVFPWQLRRGFGDYVDISQQDRGRLIVDLKAKMGLSGPRLMALSAANRLLGPLGMHVGCVSPTITMVLQKRGEGGAGDG